MEENVDFFLHHPDRKELEEKLRDGNSSQILHSHAGEFLSFCPVVDSDMSVKATSLTGDFTIYKGNPLMWFYHLLPVQQYPPLGRRASWQNWIRVPFVASHCTSVIQHYKDITNLDIEKLTGWHTLTLVKAFIFPASSHSNPVTMQKFPDTISVVLHSVSSFSLRCGHGETTTWCCSPGMLLTVLLPSPSSVICF